MATAADLDHPMTYPVKIFRIEVRTWLAANFPPSLRGRDDGLAAVEGPNEPDADEDSWRRAMGGKGWGVPTRPAEYGGGGLSPAQARVLSEEMARLGAWSPIGGMA